MEILPINNNKLYSFEAIDLRPYVGTYKEWNGIHELDAKAELRNDGFYITIHNAQEMPVEYKVEFKGFEPGFIPGYKTAYFETQDGGIFSFSVNDKNEVYAMNHMPRK